jgi:Uma2 family endonuclease
VAFSPTGYRFTVKDYHRMAEADIFDPDDRVELIDGEVVKMAPIGTRHAACVRRLARLFMTALPQEVSVVDIQDPMELSEYSEPQPDVTLLRPRADLYATEHPAPADILLAIEVADTTLRFDLGRKTGLYLAGGISEVWVVDVNAEVVHVATRAGTRVVAGGESLAPQAFPDLVLQVAEIVG